MVSVKPVAATAKAAHSPLIDVLRIFNLLTRLVTGWPIARVSGSAIPRFRILIHTPLLGPREIYEPHNEQAD